MDTFLVCCVVEIGLFGAPLDLLQSILYELVVLELLLDIGLMVVSLLLTLTPSLFTLSLFTLLPALSGCCPVATDTRGGTLGVWSSTGTTCSS